MKKRFFLTLILLLSLLLLFTGLNLSANAGYEVFIVTNDYEEYYGDLVGFGLPIEPLIFEEYIFVYDEDWRGKHIYFKDTPSMFLPLNEIKKHPKNGKKHRVVYIKINNKEEKYYIKEDAFISYISKKDNVEEKKYFYDIRELNID